MEKKKETVTVKGDVVIYDTPFTSNEGERIKYVLFQTKENHPALQGDNVTPDKIKNVKISFDLDK